MVETLFTQQDLETILKNLTKTSTAKYVSSHLKPLSKDGNVEGFMGEYFILEIKYELENEKKSEEFFVKKVPTQNEIQIEMATSTNSYGKEIFFLDFLMKEYEKYGFETSFGPKCYLCKNGSLIVLENLVSKQFVLSEKYKYYDLDQCKTALLALAQYHGASMLYEEVKSKEMGVKFSLGEKYSNLVKEPFYNLVGTNEIQKQIQQKGVESLVFMIDELQGEKSYNPDFKTKINVEEMLSPFINASKYKKAIGHGDLWFKNIFFKYNNSKVIQCNIIDYQILRYFYPAYDVLTILYLNTNKEMREENLAILLQYYYDKLSEIFAEHGYKIADILPLSEFKESFNFINCSALYNSIGINSLVLLSDEILNKFMSNGGATFDGHFKMLCESFKTDLVYRKMITELIDELHDFVYSDKKKTFF